MVDWFIVLFAPAVICRSNYFSILLYDTWLKTTLSVLDQRNNILVFLIFEWLRDTSGFQGNLNIRSANLDITWIVFTRHLVCLFYWTNLLRGKEHEQDSRSYARCSTLPYPDQKDQTTTPGTTCPTLYDKCAGSFTSHRIMNIEGLWDGTSGLLSLSEKTRESNHLQM